MELENCSLRFIVIYFVVKLLRIRSSGIRDTVALLKFGGVRSGRSTVYGSSGVMAVVAGRQLRAVGSFPRESPIMNHAGKAGEGSPLCRVLTPPAPSQGGISRYSKSVCIVQHKFILETLH